MPVGGGFSSVGGGLEPSPFGLCPFIPLNVGLTCYTPVSRQERVFLPRRRRRSLAAAMPRVTFRGLPCWQAGCMARAVKQPVVLMKWYRVVSWMLDRVDHFPKNQRFVFGQRLAERSIHVLELLVEAAWSADKSAVLAQANREMEVLRWLVRLAHDRKILTGKQYEAAAEGIYECGRMVGGWQKDSQRRAASSPPPRSTPKRDPEKP